MQWLRTERDCINLDAVARFTVFGSAATWEVRAYYSSHYLHSDTIATFGKEADARKFLDSLVWCLGSDAVIDAAYIAGRAA